MPASTPDSMFRYLRCSMPCALLLALLLAGCGGVAMTPPQAPDESMLEPAENALAEARAADADTFAPRTVDAARRRLSTARDILFAAARARRDPNEAERTRVDQLVEAAELDARAALAQTQAKAVQTKLAELRGQLDGAAETTAGGGR